MVKVSATNVPKGAIGHVKSHVNLVNVSSNVEEEDDANVSDTHLCH